jgi:toxin ParE1/3/4
MRVEYSRRSIADLLKVAADSQRFGTADIVEKRIRQAIARIADFPKSGTPIEQRPGRHVVSLVRYPYKIFYRVFEDHALILHIRNTSREPWEGEREGRK